MSRRRNRGDGGGDDAGMGCLVIAILCLVAMPLVGLYLIGSKGSDSQTKTIGIVLTVVGFILWICVGAAGAR
jgi:hypothetical protein